MSCTFEIPFCPSSTDCVDCSQDHQIVVAGSDSLQLFAPKPQAETTPGSYWDIASIQVNKFVPSEVEARPRVWKSSRFIGEEQKTVHATSAKWSAPGLARHKACALAVLTSNRILSIWAPGEGVDSSGESWRRVIVVNHAVRKYYEDSEHTDSDISPQSNPGQPQRSKERVQVHQRIRAFTWSPPLILPGSDGTAATFAEYGKQFLAVATEGGHILFIALQSPHMDYASQGTEWSAKAVLTFSVSQHIHKAMLSMNNNGILSDNPRLASHLAWSKRRMAGNYLLAYIADKKLFTATVNYHRISGPGLSSGALRVDASVWILRDRNDITGPLRLVPTTQNDLLLITFGNNAVFNISLGPSTTLPLICAESHHLDGRWDSVSGITTTHADNGSVILHIASEISSTSTPTAALKLPFTLNEASMPAWQTELRNEKTKYIAQHSPAEKVWDRTWGLASSPLGDYLITCASMHPGQGSANPYSTVKVTFQSDARMPLPFSRSHQVSISARSFSVQRAMEPRSEQREQKLDELLSLPRVPDAYCFQSFSDVRKYTCSMEEAMVWHFRLNMYGHSDLRKERATRIADLARGAAAQDTETGKGVLSHLVHEVLSIPQEHLQSTVHNAKARQMHEIVRSKLDQSSVAESSPEECKHCNQPIPFEAVKWARCSTGHQFSRCALTLLTIQESGSAKLCGTCGLRYLDKLPEDHATADDVEMADLPCSDETAYSSKGDTRANTNGVLLPRFTLLQLLLTACDVCVYCGGRFKS